MTHSCLLFGASSRHGTVAVVESIGAVTLRGKDITIRMVALLGLTSAEDVGCRGTIVCTVGGAGTRTGGRGGWCRVVGHVGGGGLSRKDGGSRASR
jgi:hypothetical protein